MKSHRAMDEREKAVVPHSLHLPQRQSVNPSFHCGQLLFAATITASAMNRSKRGCMGRDDTVYQPYHDDSSSSSLLRISEP
jgi:hypothetical protein